MTDPADTLAPLRTDAAGGDPDALYRLAAALVARDELDEAFDLHRRAADAGHAGARLEYGRMLLYGVVADEDPAGAVASFLRAEHDGNPVAGYFLALVALGGIVLERDFEAMGHRLLAAAKAGYAPAMRALAMHLGRSRGNGAAMRQSEALLRDAARQGDPTSASLLAERVRLGELAGSVQYDLAALRALAAQGGIGPLPPLPGPPVAAAGDGALQLDLESALAAPPLVVRSDTPRVASLDGLLSAEECRYVIAMGAPRLKRARVLDPATGEPMVHPVRTSYDTTFVPLLEDFQLRLLQLRMAAAIGMDFTHAEQMILLRYEPGQEYRPHRDYLPAETIAADRPAAGQRAATLCCYLSDVDAGGGTAFPAADLVVEPRAGRAVAFRNTDDAGRPDPSSQHAGLPVERGEKWLATLWLRQRRYRTY